MSEKHNTTVEGFNSNNDFARQLQEVFVADQPLHGSIVVQGERCKP